MIRDLFGPPTPTKILSWSLFAAGLLAALGSRRVEEGSAWLGAGLALIGLSMLVDVLLPGGSELTDAQVMLVKSTGIPRPRSAHKFVALVARVPLVAFGGWLIFG